MYFGFVDDGMFSYRRANWPESSTILCSEEVRQVAVLVGHQDNCSVWSSSSECSNGANAVLGQSLPSVIDLLHLIVMW